jgi:hypothetical protein
VPFHHQRTVIHPHKPVVSLHTEGHWDFFFPCPAKRQQKWSPAQVRFKGKPIQSEIANPLVSAVRQLFGWDMGLMENEPNINGLLRNWWQWNDQSLRALSDCEVSNLLLAHKNAHRIRPEGLSVQEQAMRLIGFASQPQDSFPPFARQPPYRPAIRPCLPMAETLEQNMFVLFASNVNPQRW